MMSQTSFLLAMGAAVLFVSVDARIASGSQDRQSLRAGPQDSHHSMIVADISQAERTLQVCNAFAFKEPLVVTHVRTGKPVGSLEYKTCKDYTLQLMEDDQLDFKAGKLDVGTFSVTSLPRNLQTLLLIVHKRSGKGMAASFKSHAFGAESPGSAQIAVIDTYGGETKGTEKVRIYDATEQNATLQKTESLPLNSVVSISPGSYQVAMNTDSKVPRVPLSAEATSSYLVMRVGEASTPKGKASTAFPEELVVFPSPGSARSAASVGLALLMTTLLQVLLW